MERARWNAEDVSTAFQPHDMERLFPSQVDQIKGTATASGEEIVFLMGMQVKLPRTGIRIVRRTHGGAGVNDQITSVRCINRHIEKPN